MKLLRPACALVCIALLGACSGGEAEPEPEPSEASSSAYEIHPVVGERVGGLQHVGSEPLLAHGEARPVDNAEAEQVIQAVETFLNAHLDDLQRGGPGLLDTVAAPDLLVGDPEAVAAITTDLASPAAPVESARYHITAYASGTIDWVHARVEVTHPDDDVTSASMIFVIGEDLSVHLTLSGPEQTGGGA